MKFIRNFVGRLKPIMIWNTSGIKAAVAGVMNINTVAAAELYVDYICVKAVYGLWLFWEKLKGKNLNKTEQIFLIQ